ncbi:mammalian cell entry protein [Nocardioides sp. Root1257]|uniref:MCE family protein n=1 Tax=unclassified Nocardioides TaxID=2615069 RepID=UPI0006F61928|nr:MULTISPECIES: MCE family protein [unclassified Nocardioides]KQW53099.1 mammalian cell entry protein [Nocardioides sp. Root1257]KRC55787.1 mammalian cell entry protein [Nocardioides sp. Root224]
MTRSRMLRALVLVVALTVTATGCKFDGAYDLPLPGSPVSDDNSFQITADFADILNVVPKSPVMVDDVTVGEVTDVERVGWHARVTMRVKNNVELPDNAVADIRQVSLLGEKYVSLEPPTHEAATGRLSDGDTIDLADTGRNPEVEEVLGALSFLLSGGGVAQLGTITNELNQVMDGRTDRLRHLLGSLEDVVGTIDDQKADIINAMESIAHLTETLNAEKKSITGALDVAGPAVAVLADQHDELIAMLGSLDKLGKVGTRVIGASKDDILASLDHLQPILAKLHAAGDSLAPGLNLLVSFPFPKEASDIVKGDYANTSIRADINLENIIPNGGDGGGVPGLPNPGEVLTQVEKCLRSGDLTSKACLAVLDSVNLLKQLRADCKKPAYQDNPVCKLVNVVPGGDGDTPGLPGLPGIPGLPGLGDLLGRSLPDALTSGDPSPTPGPTALYGGTS